MGEKHLVVAELSHRDRRLLQRLTRALERIANKISPYGPGEADLGDEYEGDR